MVIYWVPIHLKGLFGWVKQLGALHPKGLNTIFPMKVLGFHFMLKQLSSTSRVAKKYLRTIRGLHHPDRRSLPSSSCLFWTTQKMQARKLSFWRIIQRRKQPTFSRRDREGFFFPPLKWWWSVVVDWIRESPKCPKDRGYRGLGIILGTSAR